MTWDRVQSSNPFVRRPPELQPWSPDRLATFLRALDPELFQLLAMAVGTTHAPTVRTDSFDSSGGGGVAERLYDAVIRQESGGKYGIVNKDSGALGIGQVMPANVRSWSKEALGYSITPKQFLRSPALQDQIIKFKLDQYYREALRKGYSEQDAVRFVAAKWYSGKGERMNSMKPQNGYPTIKAYTYAVLAKFQRAA